MKRGTGSSHDQCYSVVLQDWVVRKVVNANPGLKGNCSINFSCINVFTAMFCVELKTEGKTEKKSYNTEVKDFVNPLTAPLRKPVE